MTAHLQSSKSFSRAPLREGTPLWEGTSEKVQGGSVVGFTRTISPWALKDLEVHDKAIAGIIHPPSSNDAVESKDESRSTGYSEAPIETISSIRSEDIRHISLIGTGRFCKVHLAADASGLLLRDSSSTNERRPPSLVAVKSINPNRIKDDSELVVAAGELANEAKILSGLNHKNIIRLKAVCSDSFSKSFCANGFSLVFEVLRETLCDRVQRWRRQKNKKEMPNRFSKVPGATSSFLPRLLSKLKIDSNDFKHKIPKSDTSESTSIESEFEPKLGEHTRKMYRRIKETLLGITDGLVYLHSNGIILRDLKPANIGYEDTSCVQYGSSSFSDGYGGDETIDSVRLFDFGMAQRVESCDPLEVCGTLRYMAPEVMAGKGYSLKVDTYSFGVVLFEICSLCRPFAETFERKQRLNKIFRKMPKLRSLQADGDKCLEVFRERFLAGNTIPANHLDKKVRCPKLRAIIEDCCAFDPNDRPTILDIRSRLTSIFKKD